MAAATKADKILIIGATGYLGKYMVKASLAMGHPTLVYTRPFSSFPDPSKLELLRQFESLGVKVLQGDLDEHTNLVSAIKQVDVVISTLPVPQFMDQLKIIDAIKEVGSIKRFVPSEYGNEVDRVTALAPFQRILNDKKKIRRATEAAGIPFTFVSGNAFSAYFVDFLLHPGVKNDNSSITIYGDGKAKAVLNYEEDVAAFTIKAASDPRAHNRILVCRPPGNIVSQLDLVKLWENKTGGRILKKTHLPEEEIVKLSQVLPHPDNIRVSILHNIFVKGEQMSFELQEDDLEASRLYPDYDYTSIDRVLDIFIVEPPKIKLSTLV